MAELKVDGVTTLGAIARALTEAGLPTAKGAATWSPMQVSRLLAAISG